jgi:hypothetical protein
MLKQSSLRRQQHDTGVRRLAGDSLHCAKKGLGLHYHAGTSAEGSIIDLTMFIAGVVAKIVDVNLNQACLDRAPHYSKIKDPVKDLRKDRYNIKPHFAIDPEL